MGGPVCATNAVDGVAYGCDHLGVALGCFVFALPLAVLRGLTDLPWGGLWDLLFLIPFMVPPYIGAFAWVLTLQPAGYSTQLLGFNLGSLLFSLPGIIIVMTLHLFPVVYFALSRTLAVICRSVILSAASTPAIRAPSLCLSRRFLNSPFASPGPKITIASTSPTASITAS